MVAINLEPRCQQSVNGIQFDPQPDWTFDTLLSELNSIEKKISAASEFPLPFTKLRSRELSVGKDVDRTQRPFVMRISNNEVEGTEHDEEAAANDHRLVSGKRFACNEIYLSDSDDSGDELGFGNQSHLMNKVGLVEGALSELTLEHQLSVTEEIRNRILAFETDLMNENEKFTNALSQVEKYTEVRREMDRKLDIQYQRRIAEALDNHLTAVQRNHAHKSQIEERRIKDEAALEEAKQKEKALQEEKVRQEKKKAEEELQARLEDEKRKAEEEKAAAAKAEEEKAAAAKAERRPAKEAAERVASEASRKAAATVDSNEAVSIFKDSRSDGSKEVQSSGSKVKGAESALKLEEHRLQIYYEVTAQNKALGLVSNKDYRSHGMLIQRHIKTVRGVKENVRTKANELIKIINSSPFPQSISISIFADKVVSQCVNPVGEFNNAMFAYAHVIVLVTSKVPLAMEIVLAELNRACIFTVPKYINYSKSAFETKEAYYKAIGYQEEDGNIESTDSYVARLSSYMKLYGALVQTEINGIPNLHGIKEGWAWFARFLNALPANVYTATALQSLLEMAGFALHRRYKGQFKKLLNIIEREFLNALGDQGDSKMNKIVINLKSYLESEQYLREPEGWHLQDTTLSRQFF